MAMAEKKFAFILFTSESRPDVPAGALQLATNMKAFDADIDLFLMDEGALLAKPGYAAALAARQKPGGFSSVDTLLRTLVDDFGVTVRRSGWHQASSCSAIHSTSFGVRLPGLARCSSKVIRNSRSIVVGPPIGVRRSGSRSNRYPQARMKIPNNPLHFAASQRSQR